MKANDQHMDDIFRKAAEEQQFPYKADFWNDVESQLNDDSLDVAFKAAAGHVMVMPDLNLTEVIEDAFMDDAFKSAAENDMADYPANAWSTFLTEAAAIEQDIAFTAAANSVTADYHPAFWSDADQALQNEGLHYEYKSAYWNEAKHLLDHADRRIFFLRWSAVAAVLLLFSFGGLYQTFNDGRVTMPVASNSHVQFQESQLNLAEENNTITAPDFTPDQVSENLPVQDNVSGTRTPETNVLIENSLVIAENSAENRTPETVPVMSEAETLTDLTTSTTRETIIPENIIEMNTVADTDALPEVNSVTPSENEKQETEMNVDLSAMPRNAVNGLNTDLYATYFGPQVEIERFKLAPTHTLSLIANAGIGNKYGEPDFTPSLRTAFGFEYECSGFGRLRNFEFGGSATLNHVRQNNFGTEKRSGEFNIEGGMDKYWFKLQYKDMIYANISGLASYRLNKRSSVRLFAGFDYLVFVQSNMSYKVTADEAITTVNNNWGVKDGLTKLDARLGLGYEFSVTPRFALQLNGSFGCVDRSDNEFISKNFFDHEMNATVGLKYTFLRKL